MLLVVLVVAFSCATKRSISGTAERNSPKITVEIETFGFVRARISCTVQ